MILINNQKKHNLVFEFKQDYPCLFWFLMGLLIVVISLMSVTVCYSIYSAHNYSDNHILKNVSFVLENLSYVIGILGFTSVIFGIVQYNYSQNEESSIVLDKTRYLINHYFDDVCNSIESIEIVYSKILGSKETEASFNANKDITTFSKQAKNAIKYDAYVDTLNDSNVIQQYFPELEKWSNSVNEDIKASLIDENDVYDESHKKVVSILNDFEPAMKSSGFKDKYKSCYQLLNRWTS